MAMVEVQGRDGGKYEAHSERRFIQPAGTLFASERLFFFLLSDWGAETSHV